MSETQRIKDKKKTITTFRISLTLFHSKSPQSFMAYVFLFQIFPINNMFLPLLPSRIFFIFHYSSLYYQLVIQNSLVTCQVLVSSNHSLNFSSYVLGVIYLNISDLILLMLICNQRHIHLSLSLAHYWLQSSSLLSLLEYIQYKMGLEHCHLITLSIN